MQLASQALCLSGEDIITPFPYMVTTNSNFWERCNPVFVGIHPQNLNSDVTKSAAATTLLLLSKRYSTA